MFLIDLISHH